MVIIVFNQARCCARCALTTASDPHFKMDCDHPRPDGTVGDRPKSMEERVMRDLERCAKSSDWSDDCMLQSCNKQGGKVRKDNKSCFSGEGRGTGAEK